MGCILEALTEIFFEGVIEFSTSKKAPRLLKVFVLACLLFLVALLGYWAYIFREDIGLLLFMGTMSVLMLLYTGRVWWKIKKQ